MYKILGSRFSLFCGVLSTLLFTLFTVLSTPLFIYRWMVILWSKIFKNELRQIVSGTSAAFVADYFSECPPRSNIVLSFIFEGKVTYEEIRKQVIKNWINFRKSHNKKMLNFEKFLQRPVRWMGFVFWEDVSATFLIANHVHLLSDKNIEINEKQFQDVSETLFNTRLSAVRSPWDIHVIENYKHSADKSNESTRSILIFRFHHIMTDGFGIFRAITEGLFEDANYSRASIPQSQPTAETQVSIFQTISHIVTLPLATFREMSYNLSHNFKSCPWKLPDEMKSWKQYNACPDLVPIEYVKVIKNHFRVSFSSVVLSALYVAIQKGEKVFSRVRRNAEAGDNGDSVVCMTVNMNPDRYQADVLSNHYSGVTFDLPRSKRFSTCYARLAEVDRIFEGTKDSVKLWISQSTTKLLGSQCRPVLGLLSNNKMVSIAFSNIPGPSNRITFNGKSVVDIKGGAGLFTGDAGIAVFMMPVGKMLRISMISDEGLLTKEEAHLFLTFLTDEITLLYEHASLKTSSNKFDNFE